MAEVIRIAESAPEPGIQALPQNVEAEAALIGALMIDNRLVEDVQLKLRPDHFFEPLHARIYEAILRMTDANRVANASPRACRGSWQQAHRRALAKPGTERVERRTLAANGA